MKEKITQQDLIDFLKRLDSSLEYPVTLICVGGTELSLLGNKPYSEDIDLSYVTENEKAELLIKKAKEEAGKLGIARGSIHLFSEAEFIELTGIRYFALNSFEYKELKLKNIKLKMMDLYDLIISKIMRFEGRDVSDLENVLRKFDISESILDRRFDIIYSSQFHKAIFKEKYERFKKLFGNLLKS